jgi:hypothetical protein
MIHLFIDNMDSGETFRNYDEIFDFIYEIIGTRPSREMQRQVKRGNSVQIGHRWYNFMPCNQEAEMIAAA